MTDLPPNVKSLLDSFASYGKAQEQPAAPATYWPDQSDVELSKKYDTLYGSPHAPYATPGAAYTRVAPMEHIAEYYNKSLPGEPPGTKQILNRGSEADIQREQAIAAERSAIAKLGFNPGKTIRTPPSQSDVSLGGFYRPQQDLMWYKEFAPSAGMHESMHRGIEMLRQGNKLPREISPHGEEELIVRALMQRAYGDIEKQSQLKRLGWKENEVPPKVKAGQAWKQLESGRRMVDDPLVIAIEKAAADEIARRRPRGPR